MHPLYDYLRRRGAPIAEARYNWLPRFEPLSLTAGQRLYTAGEHVDAAYVLTAGALQLSATRYGREITTWITHEPQLFTDLQALRQNRPATMSAEALNACTIYRLDGRHVRELLRTSLAWNQLWSGVWEEAFLRTLDAVTAFQAGGAEERYRDLLEAPGHLAHAPLKTLASHIGVTPTSLSRIRNRRAS